MFTCFDFRSVSYAHNLCYATKYIYVARSMFCTHRVMIYDKLFCHIVYITLRKVIKYELKHIFLQLTFFRIILQNLWGDNHQS